MRQKIVLYNPKAVFFTMPLGLLAIGSALDPDRYDVRIIDGRLVADPKAAVLEEIDDALCLGVTVLTGAPIDDALQVLRAAKAARPELPTICGGWHPSLFPTELDSLPLGEMANQIVAALAPAGERVLLRYDPQTMPGLSAYVASALEERDAEADFMPYGAVPRFEERLAAADVYVWLPAGPDAVTTSDQAAALGGWLDEGHGRQIHFHWGAGTIGTDGIAGVHSPTYDSIYVAALRIDYGELRRRQSTAVELLRTAEIHVTTPAGTDIRFRVGDRPVNIQGGDASRRQMANARTRIDREIELPAGVIRVAPLEETVNGTVVIPSARFGETLVENLRLTFEAGRMTAISADAGEEAARAYVKGASALSHFREFALGFNPGLVTPPTEPWLPYYGYGAGAVRLSLGNNLELGGQVNGDGVRWFFFTDATVTVGETVLVRDGRLEVP